MCAPGTRAYRREHPLPLSATAQTLMNFRTLLRLANLLTLLRLFLVPPLMLCFRADLMLPALLIFGFAAATDHFDGKIARRQGVTGFGTFMDPLADKLLVAATLICLTRFEGVEGGMIPAWMVVTIIGREFIVTGLRVVFVTRYGEVVSANRWGKYKTLSQLIVISISLALLAFWEDGPRIVHPRGPIYFMMYLPLVLTVVSGLEFLLRNRKFLTDLMLTTDGDDAGVDE